MTPFHNYEHFFCDMEMQITEAVRRNHPRPWDENNITHDVLRGLRFLGSRIQIKRDRREDINVYWDFFKLTGGAEQRLGDVAFLVRIYQKDGTYIDGLGATEAKKRIRPRTSIRNCWEREEISWSSRWSACPILSWHCMITKR